MDILLLGFGFVAGVRHGFDIDHIAAISDMTSSQSDKTRGILFAALYALGHGIMVMVLGILLLVLGQSLPQSMDSVFGKIVGATLLVLGLYVLYSLFRYGSHFRMKSRWMLVFDAIQFGYHKLLHNFKRTHYHPKFKEEKYGIKTAFSVGLIHGVGAETPTQVAALATLLGIGGEVEGAMFLSLFVLGIFLSNLGVAALSSQGFVHTREKGKLYLSIGLLTAIFSLIVGISFLIG